MAGTIGTAYVQIAPNMSGIQSKIASGFKGSGSKFAEQFGSEVSGRSAVIVGAIAGVASAAANKAMGTIASSIGSAIKRVDTLNAAGKTFEYMGFKAQDSANATQALVKSIQGLPTPLDGAMRGMTALAATYQDVGLGQRVFTSLNNAILGFGGSAEMVENAVAQLSQLPLDGPLDAQTWNSLRNSGLTPVLVAMSKGFGMSVGDMKKAFGEGQLTVKDFTDKLVEMNTKGGGGLVALEKIAKNATNGIGTGFANAQTAITRGLAKIIQAIGATNISSAIASVGTAFEKALTAVAKAIPPTIKAIKDLIEYIVRNKDVFVPLAVGIAAATGAVVAFGIAMKITATIQAVTKAIGAAQAAFYLYKSAVAQGIPVTRAFNAAFGANPILLIVTAIAAVTAALVYFFAKTKTGQKIWQDFSQMLSSIWEGIKTGFAAVASFFQGIWDSISNAISSFLDWFGQHWRLIIVIVLGPLGLLIDFVTAYWTQITSVIKAAVGAIWSVISGGFNLIVGFITAVLSPIVGVFSAIWGAVSRVVGGAVSGIWNVVTSTFNSVVGFLGGVAGRIIGVFAGAGGWLYNAGRDIIQGLINGAGSLLKNIGQFFLNIVPGWIKEPFKKALGIRSPSKIFAGFGNNITQGLINGISGNASGVGSAVGKIADAAMSPFANGIDASVNVSSAGQAGVGIGGNRSTNQTVSINTVVLGSQNAAKEFFKQLNQDTINLDMGITPMQGAAA